MTDGVNLKLVVALTCAAEEFEIRSDESPPYEAVTLLLPSGKPVVEKVAVPEDKVPDPSAVEEPLL